MKWERKGKAGILFRRGDYNRVSDSGRGKGNGNLKGKVREHKCEEAEAGAIPFLFLC